MAWSQESAQSTLTFPTHVIYDTHLFGCTVLQFRILKQLMKLDLQATCCRTGAEGRCIHGD